MQFDGFVESEYNIYINTGYIVGEAIPKPFIYVRLRRIGKSN